MKLSELQEEWVKDAPIDQTNLGQEAARVPTLHAKYLSILSKTKLQLRKAESDYLNTRRMKYKFNLKIQKSKVSLMTKLSVLIVKSLLLEETHLLDFKFIWRKIETQTI